MNKDWVLFFFIVILAFSNFEFSQQFFVWGWSEFAHFWGGIFLSFFVMLRWARKSPRAFQESEFLTRCFHISSGAIWWLAGWELFEYWLVSFEIMDSEIYHDTMRDLMMDFLGSFIAAPILSKK